MNTTLEQLDVLLNSREDEHLEFKKAENHFDFEELVKYCAAIANECGGKLVLGVRNEKPRQVVGCHAFENLERTKNGLTERLHLRFDIDEVQHPAGRVLVIHISSRPIGMPIQYRGAYWMRAGESLVPMTPDHLKQIFDESGPDFSAEVCAQASMSDLDEMAIQRLKTMWRRKSNNEAINRLDNEQLLKDMELIVNGGVTYAALILLGTQQSLSRYLAQAEVIFEYKSSEVSGPAQQRKEYRQGFFLFDDDLWNTINLRNDVQHYQDGLFIWDISTFNEVVVREAILNAVSHRDYRLAGSVFIRQFPRKLEVISPGGFPPGITPENILWKQSPRNRRIAEVFAKCGLVERSGQGTNRMFEESIKGSKTPPDFTGSDPYQVFVALYGEVQDSRFLRFLEQIGKKTLDSFTTRDFLALDLIKREEPIPKEFKEQIILLRNREIIEVVGRGKGVKHILSRKLYGFLGEQGVYTRKRGLDRETNKALLLKHINEFQKDGSQLKELTQVLPQLTQNQVQNLLVELKNKEKIHYIGRTKSARWFPAIAR